MNVDWQDIPGRWTDPDSSTNTIVIDVHSSTCSAEENSLLYKLKFFITTGTIQVQGNHVNMFVSQHFTKLKCLVNLIAEETDQEKLIVNQAQPQESDDDEETHLKLVAEVLIPQKITRVENIVHIPTNLSEERVTQSVQGEDDEVQINCKSPDIIGRDIAKEHVERTPRTHKPVTEEKEFRKLREKVEEQGQMNEKILTTLNRIEGKLLQISELREDSQPLVAENDSMKAK